MSCVKLYVLKNVLVLYRITLSDLAKIPALSHLFHTKICLSFSPQVVKSSGVVSRGRRGRLTSVVLPISQSFPQLFYLSHRVFPIVVKAAPYWHRHTMKIPLAKRNKGL